MQEGGKVIKGPTWLPAPGGEEQEEEEEEEEEEDGEEEEGGKGTGAQVSRSAAKRRKQKAEQERTRRKEAAKQARTQDLTLKAGHAQASFFNLFKPGQQVASCSQHSLGGTGFLRLLMYKCNRSQQKYL
jgi:hypothetical protein